MPGLPLAALLAALALAGTGCSARCARDGDCDPYQVCSAGRCVDAGQPDGDGDVDGEADGDADGEADGDADSDFDFDFDLGDGEVRVLLLGFIEGSLEPTCDVDGDGSLDNAFADADPMLMTIFVGLMNAGAADGHEALALDLHWIPDPATPSGEGFVGTFAGAKDCDADPDTNDEPGQLLDANRGFYDAAGEPVNPLTFTVTDGAVDGGGEVFEGFLTFYERALRFHRPRLAGRLTPGMRRLEDAWLCAYFLASELDSVELSGYNVTLLGAVVAPGAVVGDATFRGTQPDVDVDGDGLEWLGADDAGRITSCRDGDGTLFESTETDPCASRPEIADGFSLTLTMQGVAARLMVPGREGEGCPVPLPH